MTNTVCDDKQNHLLDFLKGIACIGVVFIHFHFPEPFGNLISKICQFAVPLFFMIAGFYAYNRNSSTIKRRLIKIAKILLYSLLLYTVYWFISHCITHTLTSWLTQELRLKSLVKLVVFCTVDYAIPLWYLIAMLQTYILWYFVVRKKKENVLICTLPVLFIARFICTSYVETFCLSWCLKINFITCALNWFLLGYFINKNKEYIIKIPNYLIALSGLIGLLIALSHILFKTSIDISCVGLFLYVAAIFITGIKYSNMKISNILVYIGEKLSLYIYISHSLIGCLIIFLAKILLKVDIHSTWLTPIIVAISTIVFSYFTYKINTIYVQSHKK